MEIPHNAHVAVADGRKFLLLKNEGSAAEPRLVVEEAEVQPDPATRDIGTDGPGRTFTGTAGHGAGAPDHRSAYSQTDYHQQNEDNFAADAAKQLNDWVLRGRIDQLIVAAAPRALGELRKHYDKRLQAVLLGEVAKELTNRPPDEILAAISSN